MGQSLGKSQSCTKKSYYSYGLPPRRRTVPNENGNYFMKEYWGRNRSGPTSSRRAAAHSTEFWMVESEKQYREEVFQKNSENIYRQSPSSYRRGPTKFDSPFNSSAHLGKRHSVNNTSVCGSPTPARQAACKVASPVVSPLFSNSSCSSAAYNTTYNQNTYGNGKNSYPNANKYIPQCMGI